MNRKAMIRVLFVEPNPVVGRSVKLYVHGFAGHDIDLQTATNLEELEARSREHWDVVLIDDGSARNGKAELIERGNKIFATVPRISVGSQSDSLMTTCSETSIDDFFPRISVNPAALLRSVNNLIERRRLEEGMEAQEARIAETSNVDAVSGTWSEAYTRQRLEEAFHAAKRYKHELTICMLEVSDFQVIIQKYGPDMHDTVLNSLGGTLRTSMRTTDFVGRIGSSSFLIAWTHTPLSGATIALDRIKAKIDNKLFSCRSNENFTIYACYGVVPLSDEYLSCDDYLGAADKALRKALRTAPGHVEVPDPLDI